MRVEFPEYRDGVKHWNNEVFVREVDENNYCKTIEDVDKIIEEMVEYKYFKNKVDVIKYIETIKDEITTANLNNKLPKFINELYKEWKSVNKCDIILKDYPFGVKEYWKQKEDELLEIGKQNWIKTGKYIMNNLVEVINLLEQKQNIIIEKVRERRRQYNEAYRNKLKETKIIKERVVLTPEERAEHIKQSKHKYYLKRKEALKAEDNCEKITIEL